MWGGRGRRRKCLAPTTVTPIPTIRRPSCLDVSTASTAPPVRSRASSRPTITANTDSSSIERDILSKIWRRLMTALPRAIARRRSQAALRLLAAAGVAAMLGGCYQSREAPIEYQSDYRLRHPITLKEGERSVEVFLGRNRGGLTPTQRADVLSFAQVWRREATSGIIVDVPKGGPNDHAAADSMREIHSILVASGVPRPAIFVRPYRPPG